MYCQGTCLHMGRESCTRGYGIFRQLVKRSRRSATGRPRERVETYHRTLQMKFCHRSRVDGHPDCVDCIERVDKSWTCSGWSSRMVIQVHHWQPSREVTQTYQRVPRATLRAPEAVWITTMTKNPMERLHARAQSASPKTVQMHHKNSRKKT